MQGHDGSASSKKQMRLSVSRGGRLWFGGSSVEPIFDSPLPMAAFVIMTVQARNGDSLLIDNNDIFLNMYA